jgi:hypothetical protein
MADPYGNYLANLSPFAGPGLAPLGMTPEQASLYGMPKAPEAMDPGLSSLVGRVGAEYGVEKGKQGLDFLSSLSNLGHGIDPRYNSAGWDVGPKGAQTLEAAANLAMRGMMFSKPGELGALGGRLMRSWDPKMEVTANKMEKAGLPDDAIYDATKLFKTADGQWKREIPDLAGSMKPEMVEKIQNLYDNTLPGGLRIVGGPERITGKLSDFIDHPPLFYEYPEAKNIPTAMRFIPGSEYSGAYRPIRPGGDLTKSRIITDTGIEHPERGPNSLFGVTMHEVNHALANKENFASGSSPGLETSRAHRLMENLAKLHNEELKSPSPDRAKLSRIVSALDDIKKNFDPYQTYLRSAGEADSRGVQERLNMTAPQLNAISPRTTINNLVPLWNQIVRPW